MTNEQQLIELGESTIVAFHIGRGVRFHNAGHKTYLGEHKIGKFTNDLFLFHENQNDFANRFGFSSTGSVQKCITDLITDEEYDDLESAFGITKEMLGERIYMDAVGHIVGLTEAEAESGIGSIEIDGEFDTTYSKKLSDCDDTELRLIYDAEKDYYGVMASYASLREYAMWKLDIEEDELDYEDAE